MNRLHRSIIALFVWSFVFYNVERWQGAINLASPVYLVAPLIAIAILTFRQLQLLGATTLATAAVPVWLIVKWTSGYPLAGPALPLTVTESLSLVVTVMLSYQISGGLNEYRKAAITTLIEHMQEGTRPLSEVESELIKELRRARKHERPLAAVAIQVPPSAVTESLDRFSREVQQVLARQYVTARVGQMVRAQLSDHDIVTQSPDGLVALLPEVDRSDADSLVADLQAEISAELGLEVRIGIAMFPDDEVTLHALMEGARRRTSEVADAHRCPERKPRVSTQPVANASASSRSHATSPEGVTGGSQ